jgi:hypothetical protein
MAIENFKLLIRNLRKGKHAKLKIQSTANSVKFRKIGKCISISASSQPDNGGR